MQRGKIDAQLFLMQLLSSFIAKWHSNSCKNCRLVSDIDLDASTPSPSKSDASEPDDIGVHIISTSRLPQMCTNVTITNISSNSSVAEDDEMGDGLRTGPSSILSVHNQPIAEDSGPSSIKHEAGIQSIASQVTSQQLARTSSLPWTPSQERRRRKLPEIPKNKKCKTQFHHLVQSHWKSFHFSIISSSLPQSNVVSWRVGESNEHRKSPPFAVQAELSLGF